MDDNKELKIPGTDDVLRPGYKVKLGRFDTTVWTVGFGWYSNGGNRPCCGWYLTTNNGTVTKPIQSADLTDIYVIELCYVDDTDPHRSIEAIDKEVIDIRKGSDETVYESAGDAVRGQIDLVMDKIDDLDSEIEEELAAIDAKIPSLSNINYIQGTISHAQPESDATEVMDHIDTVVKLLSHSQTEWNNINTVVPKGCPCAEFRTDGSVRFKIGDGVNKFSALAYVSNPVDAATIISGLGYTPLDIRWIGASDGVAPLDSDVTVPDRYLPVSVKNVVEVSRIALAPKPGKSNTIYIDASTKYAYVWIDNAYTKVTVGDKVSASDQNGYIQINGQEVKVYKQNPFDSAVNFSSTNAPQTKAVAEYVNTKIPNVASKQAAGIILAGNGLAVGADGLVSAESYTYGQYNQKSNDIFISKGTLNAVVQRLQAQIDALKK